MSNTAADVWATVEIQVGGLRDGTRSFTVPSVWVEHVKALEPQTTYGEDYRRGTLEQLPASWPCVNWCPAAGTS